MKNFRSLALSLLVIGLSAVSAIGQNPVNWNAKQLIEPAALANTIKAKKDIPVIVSIGPGATIPGSIDVGMVNNAAGLEKFKTQVASLDKKKKIVIYCGCCPFEHCPNVRPAIDILKNEKFTNYFLLNIPHNIKTDWIDKGYPVVSNK